MTIPINNIWITWEHQRRSKVLAQALNCSFYLIEAEGPLRYPISVFRTIMTLTRERPGFLFVQNPSMILATVACLYGKISKTTVVVDRHTTFRLNKPKNKKSFRVWLFMRLHCLTLRLADLTILSNEFLANLVREAGGYPFVLPDMLPPLYGRNTKRLKGRYNILLISSFGSDEPIAEVLEAMRNFDSKDVFLYISGNYKRLEKNLLQSVPTNVVFTGFVSEQEYVDLLFSVDAAMALTTSDACMLCGCYEAISAEKPLITSNKEVLVEYFKEAVFVNNSASGITKGIEEVLANTDGFAQKSRKMKQNINAFWQNRFLELKQTLQQLHQKY